MKFALENFRIEKFRMDNVLWKYFNTKILQHSVDKFIIIV